jgi:S1-C subfamily serine protease
MTPAHDDRNAPAAHACRPPGTAVERGARTTRPRPILRGVAVAGLSEDKGVSSSDPATTATSAAAPAAKAGLRVGDVIARLDGAAVRFDGLTDARTLPRGETTHIVLVLEDLI